MKILSVIGTRPEAVKMAPVVRQLAITPGVESIVCVTAQHREMLDQVLKVFDIYPDIDLNLMRPNQSLAQITATVFSSLDPVLKDLQPDWVLAQGDTITVMATSLLAYFHRIRFGHVEAGLRTYDKWQPFPEEINRKVAGAVADLHFAPTDQSKENLLKEGVPEIAIRVTGNPVIDALHWVVQQPYDLAQIDLPEELFSDPDRRLILVTAHRRENFGEPILSICDAFIELVETNPGLSIVYPVHLNPNIQQPVYRKLDGIPGIYLLPPLDYQPLVHLMKRATLVLTDSGGLQEEAPGLGVPVLVLREVTERPEGIAAGTVRLVGAQTERIVSETQSLLDDSREYKRMSQAVNPYGDGKSRRADREGDLGVQFVTLWLKT